MVVILFLFSPVPVETLRREIIKAAMRDLLLSTHGIRHICEAYKASTNQVLAIGPGKSAGKGGPRINVILLGLVGPSE